MDAVVVVDKRHTLFDWIWSVIFDPTTYELIGVLFRLVPQIYYYQDSFGILSEYITSEQQYLKAGVSRNFINSGFQVVGSYVLTVESPSYKVIPPLSTFDLDKGLWGAFELKARYGEVSCGLRNSLLFRLGYNGRS